MSRSTLRSAPSTLLRHLSPAASSRATRTPRLCVVSKWLVSRGLASTTPTPTSSPEAVPLRKHLKEEAKRKRVESRASRQGNASSKADPRTEKWELTVGIEIHAELNTAQKLFSDAQTSDHGEQDDGSNIPANSRVAPFDAALPGSQPRFQPATLLPALRAAMALDCEIQPRSSWDRKHYFHWDQPNGYQITQYHQPFALNGHIALSAADGVPAADLQGASALRIGIKQVQMEQDTAKTINHGASSYHIDLNRAGHPLIEIITLPQIHSPQTAAAVVRKIQTVLRSVDACVTGMELGGLRADVNVSVRERGTTGSGAAYGGVAGLGQRTEIKNLASFKVVEDAIVAERNRQIAVLESGGVITGETRGFTLGAAETTRLRGKEGEVDYRYMPDPDLAPLVICASLISHLRQTLPELPDATAARVEKTYGLSSKDAKTLAALDDGARLDFLEATVHELTQNLPGTSVAQSGRAAANLILHELGGLLTSSSDDSGGEPARWADLTITPSELAALLAALQQKHITSRGAKQLLATLYALPGATTARAPDLKPAAARPSVDDLIEAGSLRLRPLSDAGYEALARGVVEANPEMAAAVRDKGQRGKVMWFVGQMVRAGEEGTVEPEKARGVVEKMLLG